MVNLNLIGNKNQIRQTFNCQMRKMEVVGNKKSVSSPNRSLKSPDNKSHKFQFFTQGKVKARQLAYSEKKDNNFDLRSDPLVSQVTQAATTFDKKSSSKRSLDSGSSQQQSHRQIEDHLRDESFYVQIRSNGQSPIKKEKNSVYLKQSPKNLRDLRYEENTDGNGYMREVFSGYFTKSQIKKGLSPTVAKDKRHLHAMRIGAFAIKGQKIFPNGIEKSINGRVRSLANIKESQDKNATRPVTAQANHLIDPFTSGPVVSYRRPFIGELKHGNRSPIKLSTLSKQNNNGGSPQEHSLLTGFYNIDHFISEQKNFPPLEKKSSEAKNLVSENFGSSSKGKIRKEIGSYKSPFLVKSMQPIANSHSQRSIRKYKKQPLPQSPKMKKKTLIMQSDSSEEEMLLEDNENIQGEGLFNEFGIEVDSQFSDDELECIQEIEKIPERKDTKSSTPALALSKEELFPKRLKKAKSKKEIKSTRSQKSLSGIKDILPERNSKMKRSQASLDLLQLMGSKEELEALRKQTFIKKHSEIQPISHGVTSHEKGTTLLRRSIFTNRPSVVFFQYPLSVGFQHSLESTELLTEAGIKLKFKISERSFVYNCVTGPLLHNGFTQTVGSSWNILWSSPLKYESVQHFNKYQHCNHFVNCWNLGRKDCMWRNVSRMKRQFPAAYEHICPQTYVFPEDYKRFKNDQKDEPNPKALWIMKPSASSCGRGVKVINKNSTIYKRSGVVVSRYIHSHLINGFKYDLRLYVLVTSFDPLKIYLYEEGLTRFATQKYTQSRHSIKRRYIHLTNYSVNKHSSTFVSNKGKGFDESNEERSSKWCLRALRKKYKEMGVNVDKLFKSIKDVIIKAIIAAEPHLGNSALKGKNVCFELYGFDILIDQNLRPWLLEVNISPSLSSSSPLDKVIKTALLTDIFNTIGVYPYDKKKFDKMEEDSRRKRILGFNPTTQGVSKIVSEMDEKVKADVKKQNNVQRRDLALGSTSLKVDELCKDDVIMLIESDEELQRCSRFERIFPLKSNIEEYRPFFQHPKFSNLLLWKWIQSGKLIPQHFPFQRRV